MHTYSYGKKKFFSRSKVKKIFGVVSIFLGMILLLYFFFPLLSYQVYLSSAYASSHIEAPLPQRMVLSQSASIGNLFESGISNVTTDYRDARNWFSKATANKPVDRPEEERIKEYSLSIPSQQIIKAKVSAVDFDLSKHLVQYFSTSKNPTDRGTSVIFGHSTLPQWFNPDDYTTIFAHMHKIKNDDEIIITVEGKDYRYKVFSISILESNDPNIFSQSFDNSYITIITCTPPGTTWKRLVVRASLQN